MPAKSPALLRLIRKVLAANPGMDEKKFKRVVKKTLTRNAPAAKKKRRQ